ncbi:MAG: tail fiber domain-containing protein [Phycisphaerae bacterium]|nr:tail fiber domain-containing protein [Phycisphaerae bacterium]
MGVFGNANAGNVGILGMVGAQNSVGVWGHNSSTGGTNWNVGVAGSTVGTNVDATGVLGQGNVGVRGSSALAAGFGVRGENSATGAGATGVYGIASGASTNATYGVQGISSSTGANAAGVFGQVTATNSTNAVFGVRGEIGGNVTAASAAGVFGNALTSTAANVAGVRGIAANASGYGVYGSNSSNSATGGVYGVFGITSGTGTASQAAGAAGVYGTATNASGVMGVSGVLTNGSLSSGRVGAGGVYGYTSNTNGNAGYFLGRLVIENTSGGGSQTSGTDSLIAWCQNNGAAGINSNAQMFANSFNLTSDRTKKENFSQIDTREVLTKALSLPITTWNFKGDSTDMRHLGTMAQDFHAAFGFNGSNNTQIGSGDMDGVLLASVQALNAKLEAELKDRDAKLAALQASQAAIEARLTSVESGVARLLKPVGAGMGLGIALIGAPILALLAIRRGARKNAESTKA